MAVHVRYTLPGRPPILHAQLHNNVCGIYRRRHRRRALGGHGTRHGAHRSKKVITFQMRELAKARHDAARCDENVAWREWAQVDKRLAQPRR